MGEWGSKTSLNTFKPCELNCTNVSVINDGNISKTPIHFMNCAVRMFPSSMTEIFHTLPIHCMNCAVRMFPSSMTEIFPTRPFHYMKCVVSFFPSSMTEIFPSPPNHVMKCAVRMFPSSMTKISPCRLLSLLCFRWSLERPSNELQQDDRKCRSS